jgi:predicted secreted protein
MRLSSIVAIYSLFWALSFFFVLPFRLQRRDGAPGDVPGTMPGAPPSFSFGRTALWTTIVAAVLFGLFYLNYVMGWLPAEAFDFVSNRLNEGS